MTTEDEKQETDGTDPREERDDLPPPTETDGNASVGDFFRLAVRFFSVDLWHADLWRGEGPKIPRMRAGALRSLRVMSLAIQRFFAHRTLFHASSLTYITILSIVPVLAVGFSMAKGMGAYERLRTQAITPFLDEYIGPAEVPSEPEQEQEPEQEVASEEASELEAATGEEAEFEDVVPLEEGAADSGAAAESVDGTEAELDEPATEGAAESASGPAPTGGPSALRAGIDKVVEFVDRTDFSVLGAFASALMLLTVIKLLSAVERSLNEIWGAKRARTLVRKFSDYLTLVIVTPILVLTATGLTASTQIQRVLEKAREVWDFDPLLGLLAPVFTLLVIWVGFTFVYLVMPNTRVKFGSALVGGMVGGTMWQGVQILHVKSQVGMAQYEVLYAGFAAFPILLFWIYLSWVVMLFGVHVAFAHQNERTFRGFAFFDSPDHAMREHVALRAMIRIGQSFARGTKPPTLDALSLRIGVPQRLLSDVLQRLEHQRIVAPVGRAGDGCYVPGRDPATIHVAQILYAVRHAGPNRVPPAREAVDGLVNELLAHVEADVDASVANQTLVELVDEATRAELR